MRYSEVYSKETYLVFADLRLLLSSAVKTDSILQTGKMLAAPVPRSMQFFSFIQLCLGQSSFIEKSSCFLSHMIINWWWFTVITFWLENQNPIFYRHLVRSFHITDYDGKTRWTAYNFIRKFYDHFAPIHLKRIQNAVAQLGKLQFESCPVHTMEWFKISRFPKKYRCSCISKQRNLQKAHAAVTEKTAE